MHGDVRAHRPRGSALIRRRSGRGCAVFPEAEAEEEQAEPEEGSGLEELSVSELRKRGRVLGAVPVGTNRVPRRSEPWVEALTEARAAAQGTAAAAAVAAATATTHAGSGSVCRRCSSNSTARDPLVRTSQPRARRPETHGFGGWQLAAGRAS
jgi:hypothetical protein